MKISKKLEEKIIVKITKLLDIVEHIWNYRHPFPSIFFDITNSDAGWAFDDRNEIHFNPILLNENKSQYVNTIVPHELAHILAPKIFKRQVKSHGNEWKAIMGVFGITPDSKHEFDVSNCKKYNIKKYIYQCECSNHHISSHKHKKWITKQIDLTCDTCNKKIKFTDRYITL